MESFLPLLRPVRAGRLWPPVSFDPPCAGGSRGEAAVVNASARVSGRQSRLQWSIISVAPAGARPLFCFLRPVGRQIVAHGASRGEAMGHILPPLRGLHALAFFPMVWLGQPSEKARI